MLAPCSLSPQVHSPCCCAATTKILQNHYPERLGLAVCYSPPKLFSFTWRVSLCACRPAVLSAVGVLQSWSASSCLGILCRRQCCFCTAPAFSCSSSRSGLLLPAAIWTHMRAIWLRRPVAAMLLHLSVYLRVSPLAAHNPVACGRHSLPGLSSFELSPVDVQLGAGLLVHQTLCAFLTTSHALQLCGSHVQTALLPSYSCGMKQFRPLASLFR